MNTIRLQIPDEMSRALRPYRGQLHQILELGLAEWKRRELVEASLKQEQLSSTLSAADGITLPKRMPGRQSRAQWTPIAARGRAASEIVLEMRD